MATTYETDFSAWLDEQIQYLRSKEFGKLDMEHLLEEMEDLGTSTKNSIVSFMVVILKHMIKSHLQPQKHTKSWDDSINDARTQISSLIEDNPSLRCFPKEIYDKAYCRAVKQAAKEMSEELAIQKEKCPWTIEEVLGD